MGEQLMNWWHIAHTPDGVHTHQLDPAAVKSDAERRCAEDPQLGHDEAVAEVLGDQAETIRAELGFPPNGRWVTREGWDSQLAPGEPHPTLLEAATVHRAPHAVSEQDS